MRNFATALVAILSMHTNAGSIDITSDLIFSPATRSGSSNSSSEGTDSVYTSFTGNEEDWNVEYNHELVLITTGDIVTPIETEEATLTLSHKNLGDFSFHDRELRSVSRHPLAEPKTQPDGTTYNVSPTLFVSIGGYKGLRNGGNLNEGEGLSSWQQGFEEELAKRSAIKDQDALKFQYVHFLVDWQSSKSNYKQVKQLAKTIKSFLSGKQQKWDVVLVGHSRGGVFAHDLSDKLINNNRIDNLHTILLDATAANSYDSYPKRLHEGNVKEYGTYFYDKKGFAADSSYAGTISDLPITNYSNYGRRNHYIPDASHETFGNSWVTEDWGLNQAISDIWSRKATGSYPLDGDPVDDVGPEEVVVTIKEDIYIDGEASCDGDECRIYGEIVVGPVAGTVNIVASENGVEAGVSAMLASTYLAVKKDQLTFQDSSVVQSISASISEGNGVWANYHLPGIDGGLAFNSENINIGGSVGVDGTNASLNAGSDGVSVNIDIGGTSIVKVSCCKL